jgi:hypothetical protein
MGVMGRFDELVELWRELSAEPRHRYAVVRARKTHERALRSYARRVTVLRAQVGSRAALAGGSAASATGLAVVGGHGGFAALLFAAAAGLGAGSWHARSQLGRVLPPGPPVLPVRPGTVAAGYLASLDRLGSRRSRLAALVDDEHAREALDAARHAEGLLRAAVHRMAAIEETAGPAADDSTAGVLSDLEAEVRCGVESYERVLGHAVQLAGVVTAGSTVVADLEDAAATLEARTYGLRRMGELGST